MFTMLKTGSAHSILKCLPLLDSFQEESDKLTYVIHTWLTCNLTDIFVKGQPIFLHFKDHKPEQA